MASARMLLASGVLTAGLTVARGGLSWSTHITEDPNNPTMADLGNSFVGPFESHAVPSVLSPAEQVRVTQESDEFVEAAIKSFLNKQNLPPAEMRCLQQGSGEIGGNVGSVVDQLGVVLRKAFGRAADTEESRDVDANGKGDRISPTIKHIPLPPAPAPAGGQQAAQAGGSKISYFYGPTNMKRRLGFLAEEAGVEAMMGPEAVPMAIEIGLTMQKVVREMHELVGQCLHSDAKLAFEKAGDHALNLKYLTGHFLANGADIVDELADSVMAYEKRNATVFGTDVGKALRKIFLSSNANGRLPEGLPGDAELANVTEGFLLGFFGPGTFLDVHLQKDPAHPVHVDMQRCVSQDVQYFQQIWASTMYMFAQGASGAGPVNFATTTGKIEFATMLAFTLMELPAALGKCGISPEQEAMLMDAVKSLGTSARAQVKLPGDRPSKDEMATSFATTLKEWSEHHWLEFGQHLGSLLQQSAVRFYPQKYSLSSAGALRAQLSLGGGGRGRGLLFAAPLGLLALLAAVAVRQRRRHLGRADSSSEDEIVAEDAGASASQRGLLSADLEECLE